MANINHASLASIPSELADRMVVFKPFWLGDRAIRNWREAVNHLVKNFWGAGADCGFPLEARAVFNEGGTYNSYDAVVTIYPDGRYEVRLIH